MDLFHSLPTLNISPLKNIGLANLNLKLKDDFTDMVLSQSVDWKLSKFAHREHNEQRGYKADPSNIESQVKSGELDSRVVVRQLRSGLKQENYFGDWGNIQDKRNKVTEYLCDEILKDNAKYFNKTFMLKFTSEQGLLPHKDGGGTSRLYIPISPFGEDYSRLEFYHDNQIYYVYNDIAPTPVYLFSSRVIHAVFNQGYPERINLQINSSLSYEETLELFNED